MVQLLLKKKASVNCRLDERRHAKLSPLHIACGCLETDVIDIVRLLLESGADVNAESSPARNEFYSLINPAIVATIKPVITLLLTVEQEKLEENSILG